MEHVQIVQWLLQTLNQVKVYHWATKSYAAHKALDEFHEKLSELADTFVEMMMGKMGPIKGGAAIRMEVATDANPKNVTAFIEAFCENARSVHKSLATKKATELQNILDEMMGLADKTVYLLTLQ